jgi:uncharacterized metal-binding protein YceD (DUF177 family)
MKPLKEYDISFTGLKSGSYQFNYNVDKKFFEAFNFDEFLDSNVKVNLDFVKKSNLFELHFLAKGDVKVLCDISMEPYDQPVDCELNLIVKFGEEYNDDNEELIIIPYNEHYINVSQFIYEMIVLAMPGKRIHPRVLDGTLKSDIVEKLEELNPENKKKEHKIDPRWEELKKLITNKNK